jgi:hypothetical protein
MRSVYRRFVLDADVDADVDADAAIFATSSGQTFTAMSHMTLFAIFGTLMT